MKFINSEIYKTKMELTKKQQKAIDLMLKGESVFITGPGGVGKTEVIKRFYQDYKDRYQKRFEDEGLCMETFQYRLQNNIAITSTTGISALIIGGTTIHSFLGLGLGKDSIDDLFKKIFSNGKILKRWKELRVLIIDEVSMLDLDLLEKIEELARKFRLSKKFFGGIQLVFSGDFCQLPCVGNKKFCFESKIWDDCVKHTIYLTEVIRQTDKEFKDCLNEIRLCKKGGVSKKTMKLIESRVDVELEIINGIEPTKFYAINAQVDYINESRLFEIDNENVFEYDMNISFLKKTKYSEEKYLKNLPCVNILKLTKGCQVMLVANLKCEEGLVNGSRGVVTGFIDDIPIVKFLNGVEMELGYHIWDVEEDGKKIVSITQIPLRLGYAYSIHKSQSLTLDYATIDLGSVFEYGQAYVALSRVKNLEGLSITNLDWQRIKAHPKAIEYYSKLEEE
jgi:ATP-dependent DNA helicase PIF1